MVDYISERTAGQIISDSIRLYVRNFPAIFLVYMLPIFSLILLSGSATASGDPGLIMASEGLKAVVSFFTLGAVTLAVSDACLGNQPSIKRSYAGVGRVFWNYLGTYLLDFLAVLLGMVLLVLPGLYAIVALLFCLPVCIIERRSPIDACRRSMALGKGHYLRNLGVLLLVGLVGVLGMMIIGGLSGMIMAAAGFRPMSVTFLIIVGVLTATMSPLLQIPAILLYYDMRARKENFDGAALAQELMT
jgi:hypothetical protein